jgi:hypothetical protein
MEIDSINKLALFSKQMHHLKTHADRDFLYAGKRLNSLILLEHRKIYSGL